MKFSRGDIICCDDQEYPEGALVCDGYDEAGRLLAHPVPGGFQVRLDPEHAGRFKVVADGEQLATYEEGRFVLDDLEHNFPGWTNRVHWAGWEMPRFRFAVCEQILEYLAADTEARFDAEADAFVTVTDGEEERWPSELVTLADGSQAKVYPLGAGSWMWWNMDRE